MQIGMALDALREIAKLIRSEDKSGKLSLYGAYCGIEASIVKYTKDRETNLTKINEELRRFRFSIEAICGLSRGNSHTEDQHISWMLAAVSGLESDMCLGKFLNDPE